MSWELPNKRQSSVTSVLTRSRTWSQVDRRLQLFVQLRWQELVFPMVVKNRVWPACLGRALTTPRSSSVVPRPCVLLCNNRMIPNTNGTVLVVGGCQGGVLISLVVFSTLFVSQKYVLVATTVFQDLPSLGLEKQLVPTVTKGMAFRISPLVVLPSKLVHKHYWQNPRKFSDSR